MIYKAGWHAEHDQLIFHIEANRFLRNMVRALVGSLLEVGYGNKPVSWFQGLLDGGSRSDAGQSVPAHGLFLEHVGYPDEG
jgi:tRNA pseudouridine38-40 synthase